MASALMACAVLGACNDAGTDSSTGGSGGAPNKPAPLPKDAPVPGITDEQLVVFDKGDNLFGLPLHDADGLGPLYTRNNCAACHTEGLRGPGLVQKMSVVEADGFTAATDQSKLPFGHTVHPLLTAGATTPIVPPMNDPTVKVTVRMGPPVVGRGFMEAVLDSEIERLEAEQAARPDAIHGRINHVKYASEKNPDSPFPFEKGADVIGRFGLKARIPTLDDFTADALNGDMGATSPMRPAEFPNPDGLLDDAKGGVDISLESINLRANYMRMLDIPRAKDRPAGLERGAELFVSLACNVCHAPALKTRADYPIAPIAGKSVDVYTDFLLHDMGDALADGLEGQDGEATSREWRTAPLMGISQLKTFLHDGRAKSVAEAIELHGGKGAESADSATQYGALSEADRQALIAFVSSL
ncbi:MAG: di-heme oxidoredictase family protein [Polyangiaceae bacterium]